MDLDATVMYDYNEKFTFTCEWYDDGTSKLKQLSLMFYPYDNSIMIYDISDNRIFVKRVQYHDLKLGMLKIGAVINVFSRLLHITDCTPDTSRKLFGKLSSTFGLIKPVHPEKWGEIIATICEKGFHIVRVKKGRLNKDFAAELYKNDIGDAILPIVIEYVTSDEIIGMELMGHDAVNEWKKAAGFKDPSKAAPGTLRSMYGETVVKNVVHGCSYQDHAMEMMNIFFDPRSKFGDVMQKPTLKNCTCCIIKPHAMKEGLLGYILSMITKEKFKITCMCTFQLKMVDALEFYEVYKDVVPEYEAMALQLAQGTSLVMELLHDDKEESCVNKFRKLCGPRDPDLCRQVYPDTIRAHYGRDIVHNAVHCTDLEEDGVLEVEYFFKLLL